LYQICVKIREKRLLNFVKISGFARAPARRALPPSSLVGPKGFIYLRFIAAEGRGARSAPQARRRRAGCVVSAPKAPNRPWETFSFLEFFLKTLTR
jgi:hypothetical protein